MGVFDAAAAAQTARQRQRGGGADGRYPRRARQPPSAGADSSFAQRVRPAGRVPR
ncbi:hypothetical protein C731_1186 [Mycolicibacterium hassiacum DSM 44199]|uniref:Uncharacterized protein n=1 Tax=Mycolicibacterium hassiacum (strain DSM 44199 / CIP 105218 / JCM 12690 / 3849) TaxID=1122247 RepID=K5BKG3_MYCHD|nr:hypothetical protein C731_1186 [Mycolicibacterium hassiacum DSM 44199]